MQSDDRDRASDRDPAQLVVNGEARRPYPAPALEHLGSWSALTLQQSVPILSFLALFHGDDS